MQCDRLNGGKAAQLRQVVNDTRGHVAELLAESINRGALDQELTHDDRERMLEFLRQYGDLAPDLLFKGRIDPDSRQRPGHSVFRALEIKSSSQIHLQTS